MQRRKFLATVGSLAAGSVAAMGTGAFTTASAKRNVNVNVAEDSEGFIDIVALDSDYASGTDDGKLQLDFNSDSGWNSGQGPNLDGKFNFEDVFQIQNPGGQGDMRVVIEASGFTNLESFELTDAGDHTTFNNDESQMIDGNLSIRAKDHDSPDTLPKLVEPDSMDVDITMETGSETTSVEGTLTIHAATGDNREKLSDVL